jgi:cytochrome c biogenesis protein CcmG/thiol:disulfide interchange protein DsbE
LLAALLIAASMVPSACGTSGGGTARVGDPAPEISAVGLDGQPVRLSSLRGRPVLVNFWASWCVPCRQEMPLLRDELQQHSADGFAIVGVIFKDQGDPAREFARAFGATWPSALDPDGAIAKAYRVVAPPQSYFVDRNGILRSIQVGEILESDFVAQYPAISR